MLRLDGFEPKGMTMSDYAEGQVVKALKSIDAQADGSDWPAGQEGTLMQYMGDGDWLVYVPGHGSPLVNETDFQ